MTEYWNKLQKRRKKLSRRSQDEHETSRIVGADSQVSELENEISTTHRVFHLAAPLGVDSTDLIQWSYRSRQHGVLKSREDKGQC